MGVETRTSSPPDNLKSEIISLRSTEGRKSILKLYCRAIVDGFTNLHLNSTSNSHTALSYDDKVLGYAIELLTLGLLYVEFTDAVKEGDGQHVHRCWKFMLPLFKMSGRTNYTIEAFTMLYSHAFLFSPRQAAQFLWCRFVNGKNIAMDLHMEHLNRVCKDALRGLGANKTPKAIQRVGKCVGVLKSMEGWPSLPARPVACIYASTSSGGPTWIIWRMSGQSMPSPKATVAITTLSVEFGDVKDANI